MSKGQDKTLISMPHTTLYQVTGSSLANRKMSGENQKLAFILTTLPRLPQAPALAFSFITTNVI